MPNPSQAELTREAALKSGDPNRVLWVFHKDAARRLFMHGLNVASAIRLLDEELLSLSGIGPKTVHIVRSIEYHFM